MIRIASVLCLLISLQVNAQYYYKDLITTRQTIEKNAAYKLAKVQTVSVVSYEENGQRMEDFNGTQTISTDYTKITTTLKTPLSGESELTTYFDANGRLVRSIDTTDGSYSESQYFYNSNNSIARIRNVARSPGETTDTEEHLWSYNNNGRPEKMLRIKNGNDTTYISLVLDEDGAVTEEKSIRRNMPLPPVYYYYDDDYRITDIVSYNDKAKRLLPLYMFEYNDKDQLISMIVVPEGTDDYQKWVYEYNAAGLKIRETALNKRRQVLGRVEYQYK
jgi:hypothetical protein